MDSVIKRDNTFCVKSLITRLVSVQAEISCGLKYTLHQGDLPPYSTNCMSVKCSRSPQRRPVVPKVGRQMAAAVFVLKHLVDFRVDVSSSTDSLSHCGVEQCHCVRSIWPSVRHWPPSTTFHRLPIKVILVVCGPLATQDWIYTGIKSRQLDIVGSSLIWTVRGQSPMTMFKSNNLNSQGVYLVHIWDNKNMKNIKCFGSGNFAGECRLPDPAGNHWLNCQWVFAVFMLMALVGYADRRKWMRGGKKANYLCNILTMAVDIWDMSVRLSVHLVWNCREITFGIFGDILMA